MFLLRILINIIFINIVITQNVEASSDESDVKYIMSKGEIFVGYEANKPPMTYVNDIGELTGFDIEFSKAVSENLGIDVVFKEIDWNIKDKELNSKNIDCIWSSMTLTEERRKYFSFSRVYINNRPVVIIRRSDASKYPNIQSFVGINLTAGVSTSSEDVVLSDPYLSQSNYSSSSSQNNAIDALKNGTVDAAVVDYTIAKSLITSKKSKLMIVENILLQEEQYAVGFRHNSDMPKKINDIFVDMILDGSLYELSEKYNLIDVYKPLEITDAGYILETGKMILGVQDSVPPMSYYNNEGQLTGFDIDFAKAVCQQLGVEPVFKPIHWEKKIIELRQRNIDCIWNALTVTEERRSSIKFSRIYMTNSQAVIIRKSDASKYTDLESLIEANVSSETGSTGELLIETDEYLSQSNFVSANSIDKSIEYLKNGEVDAVVFDSIIANDYVVESNGELMVIEGCSLSEEVYAVGFRVGSDMTLKVNEVINDMLKDGTLEAIAKKYNIQKYFSPIVELDETSDLNYIMSKGELVVGYNGFNSPPMTYYDKEGELTGFDIEFAKDVCAALGIDIKFKVIDWDKKEEELNKKTVDCIWNSLTVTEERHCAVATSITSDEDSDLTIVSGIHLKEEQFAVGFRVGSDILKKINNIILDMIMDNTLADLAIKYDLIDLFKKVKITDADYIFGNGKIVIGYDENFPPLTYHDDNGDAIGFDVECAKAVCKELGIEAEFVSIDRDLKENELVERNIDCIWSGLAITDEERETKKFTRAYMGNRQVVVIKKSSASIFTDLKSLSEAKVSAEGGYTGDEAVQANFYLSQSSYIPSDSMDDAIKALQRGEFDAIVIDYTIALDEFARGTSDLMVLTELNTHQAMYGVGFRLGSDMTIHVNKIINKFINEGIIESLTKNYNLHDLYLSVMNTNENTDMNYIMTKGELIIGIDGTYNPPMSYYNEYGELTGFDIEFAKEVCSKLGIDIIFKIVDWEQKEEELSNKNIDCMWNSLTLTEERRKYFEFTNVYLDNRPAVVIRISDEFKYKDAESLSGANISAIIESTGEEAVSLDPYLSKANYVGSKSQDDLLRDLKKGIFDAVVLDYTVARSITADADSEFMFVKRIILKKEQFAVGFRVGSDMVKKVNEIFMDMSLDGSLELLAKKYGVKDLFEPYKITDANYIINKGKMIIGYKEGLPPFSYNNNNQLTGFDIELAKTVCKHLGVEAEFIAIDWDQKIHELKKQDIDCIWSGLSVSDELRENIKFSRVYMNDRQAVVIRKTDIFKYTNIKSLSEAKIASRIESQSEDVVKTLFTNISYFGFASIEEMLHKLHKGSIDAVIIDYTLAKYNINHRGYTSLFIVENIEISENQYAIGFRYGSDMTKKVNEIINNMIADGSLKTLAKKFDIVNLYMSEEKSNNIAAIVLLMISYFVLILVF
ncbi:hypothetical protein PIROE2DRAFT_2614 [Piromyces sp. E2]|nr:hypothetical protein PIROE2DRAFT_2614 [Piromyces sp. E2]|eukprot:OUM69517.1 hypothetical protein PIROE2DRAFT_2614 [Piromyces sp. E2]